MIIFDLDGTLALIDHRRHFVERPPGEKKDFKSFYAACVDDQPNWPIIELAKDLHWFKEPGRCEVWSGRSDAVEAETRQWLNDHGLAQMKLRMRPADDYRPDVELKQQWLLEVGAENIKMVFDDRDQVVAMWRRHGITCLQVAPGDF